MRWRRWTARGIGLLVLVALVTVSGALSQAAGQALQDDPRAELRRQMDEAEQRWQASGITSYQIVVRRLNGPWQIQWNTVVVRDGQIVESSARCGRALAGPDRCQVQPFEPAGQGRAGRQGSYEVFWHGSVILAQTSAWGDPVDCVRFHVPFTCRDLASDRNP